MLTDYHTHLRPDVLDATPERFFTEENVQRYVRAASERGIVELGFSEHVYRFMEALTVWRHPFWEECALDDLDEYCGFVQEMKRAGHSVKLGIEADYIVGTEERLEELLTGRPWDYVIGSVHFITPGAVDHDGYDAWDAASTDEVWSGYFHALGEAAATGLFDVLAHPDLVKVWGPGRPLPERPLRSFYELALEQIERADVAIEVSTAGLRKPAGELYPSRELLELCLEAGKPVALSSDAHEPAHVGFAYEKAVALLRELGVETLATFSDRRRSDVPLG